MSQTQLSLNLNSTYSELGFSSFDLENGGGWKYLKFVEPADGEVHKLSSVVELETGDRDTLSAAEKEMLFDDLKWELNFDFSFASLDLVK